MGVGVRQAFGFGYNFEGPDIQVAALGRQLGRCGGEVSGLSLTYSDFGA